MSNTAVAVKNDQNMDMFEIMEKANKFAEIFAKADIIPQHYKGKHANCFIAVQSAFRMNLDPFLVMQNTFIVAGSIGMRAQFAIALGNNSGVFQDNISFEVVNRGLKTFTKTGFPEPIKEQYQDIAVTANAKFKKSGKPLSFTATMQMAVDEDWIKNPKYKSIGELMLTYRAATFLLRTSCPEVLLGMQTVEELEDVTPQPITASEALLEKVKPITTVKPIIIETPAETQPETVEPVQEILPTLAEQLSILIMEKNVPTTVIEPWLTKANVTNFADMKDDDLQKCIMYIHSRYQ